MIQRDIPQMDRRAIRIRELCLQVPVVGAVDGVRQVDLAGGVRKLAEVRQVKVDGVRKPGRCRGTCRTTMTQP